MIGRILANFVVSAILVGSAVVLSLADNCSVVMPNPKLDVAFLCDQSESMRMEEHLPGVRRAVIGLKNWTLEYSSTGKKDIRFAVISCKEGQDAVKKQFGGGKQTPASVGDEFPFNEYDFGGENNVEKCFSAIDSHSIFEEKTGARPDAPKIILCKNLLK